MRKLSEEDKKRKETLKKELTVILNKDNINTHDLENMRIILSIWEKHKY